MRRPQEVTWLRAGAFTQVALGVALLGLLAFAFYAVAADRDRAFDQTDAALAQVAQVREDAVSDRRAMRERNDALLAEIEELRDETRLLREQVDSLTAQVRDLGGIPGGGPEPTADSDPAVEEPASLPPARAPDPSPSAPGPPGRAVEPPARALSPPAVADQSEPELPGSTPPHAQRPGDAGPPDHAQRGKP